MAALGFAIVGELALAGCGGDRAGTAPPVPSIAATAAPTSGTTTVSSPNACGGGAAAAIKQHVDRPEVLAVTIIGGCHQAAIATSLDSGDATTGLAICDSAAEVAYVDGISSITVSAANNKELAAGLKDAPCIGEP
jgi:hypothetical protein